MRVPTCGMPSRYTRRPPESRKLVKRVGIGIRKNIRVDKAMSQKQKLCIAGEVCNHISWSAKESYGCRTEYQSVHESLGEVVVVV
jgi:hypothetical protein